MSKENVIKLYNHFSKLANGDFSESDFSKEYGDGEEGGRMFMGKMTPEREALIISDAQKHKKELETKTKVVRDPKDPKKLLKILAFPYLTEKKDKEDTEPKKKKSKKS